MYREKIVNEVNMRSYYAFLFLLISMMMSCSQDVESLEEVMINGVNQKILVKGDTEKPLILYLHGGPGYSSILESQVYTDIIKDHSLFVQWDQRGTGYSYNENIDTASMTIEQFVEDTKTLTDYLMKRYRKEKIYLAGHSWGSAIGFYAIQKYPELYQAFIGVGQVINRKEHIETRINWVREKMVEANDTTGLAELNENVRSNAKFIFQYGGFMHRPVNVDSITRKSPYYSDEYLSLLKKGAAFSSKYIPDEEQNKIDLTKFSDAKIPIYFFLGRHDWLAPTSYPVTYLQTLASPEKKVVWFENSGHLPMMEEPKKFQEELIAIINQE